MKQEERMKLVKDIIDIFVSESKIITNEIIERPVLTIEKITNVSKVASKLFKRIGETPEE